MMTRFVSLLKLTILALIVIMPLMVSQPVRALDCLNGELLSQDGTTCMCPNGAVLSQDGMTCVCPSGKPSEKDGTCKTDPFAQACVVNSIANTTSSACNTTGQNPISGKDGIIFRVINIFSYVIGVASVLMIIFAGFRYVTSNGDSKNIATAKNTILYAVIGIVVFLLSRGIITFVINKV